MKKAQNGGLHLKKCSIKNKNCDDFGDNNNNENNRSNNNSFYELCLSLIWCFVFLFYCEVCLSDGHGGTFYLSLLLFI